MKLFSAADDLSGVDLKLIEILAQTLPSAVPATQGRVEPPWYVTNGGLLPIFAVVILLYFFMFRSKKTEQSKREEMLTKLKKGDEVQTIGGEFGRVVDTRDDRVQLKVDETSNTKIWYARNSIHRVVTGDAKVDAK